MTRSKVEAALLIAAAALFAASLGAQQTADKSLAVFRGSKWGAAKAEVLKLEGREPVYDKVSQGLNSVVFEDEVLGMKAQVIYSFFEGKLARGGYAFLADHEDRNLYVDDYQKLREALTKRFGEPLEKEDKSWSGGSPKSGPKEWGKAVAAGQLSFMSDWETADTEIVLSLSGGGPRISLGLVYISKQFEKLQQDKQGEAGKKR